MIAHRQYLQRLPLARPADPVHQAMLAVDAPRPPAGEVALERLGLAGAGERVAQALADEEVELYSPRWPPFCDGLAAMVLTFAFFGLRASLLDRCCPLAMAVLLRLRL